MSTTTNDRYSLAMKLAETTNKHLFLTGKAGTGKTTFLHRLRERTFKRHIVVAPTGVAAINAHGVTIHSFFQLPLRPLLPDELKEHVGQTKQLFRFHSEKQKIIRGLDLLIIDEISMVRADILDAIDFILRTVRKIDRPFGNVQLLMIGDLYQLAPVVRDEDWQLLSNYYESPFFFESRALKQTEYLTIELDKIFRQQNEDFIKILNKIREGIFDTDVQTTLHRKFVPDFDDRKYENYILLTTHNAKANHINQSKLNELPGEEKIYQAIIKGNFPKEIYPTEASLALKIGAQVMFLRNDTSENKQYYNGKVGKIVELDDDYIEVETVEDGNLVKVEPVVWENIQYTFDPESKSITEEVIGTFEQYPLKLAWAITIHKSQGLTFDKVAIDAQHAFAPGQVYVALSRCRSLEGLILLSKINFSSVRINPRLRSFSNIQSEPKDEDVVKAQKDFLFLLLEELFTFNEIETALQQYIETLPIHFESLNYEYPQELQQKFHTHVVEVGNKFLNYIAQNKSTISAPLLPQHLQERIIKGTEYFNEQLSRIIDQLLHIHNSLQNTDDIRKISKARNQLMNQLAQKKHCLQACRKGFSVETYFRAKTQAVPTPPKMYLHQLNKQSDKPTNPSVHKELTHRLKKWRSIKADETNLKEDHILSNPMILKLSLKKPLNHQELAQLIKLPDKYATTWQEEILHIIKECIN